MLNSGLMTDCIAVGEVLLLFNIARLEAEEWISDGVGAPVPPLFAR